MKLASCLVSVALTGSLAGCVWSPGSVVDSATTPSKAHKSGLVASCSDAFSATSTVLPRHVRGPVLTPATSRRAFAGLGMYLRPISVDFFWKKPGIKPVPRAAFSFVVLARPIRRTMTGGMVVVYRTDGDAVAARRSYGPHIRGECDTYLRVGNVLIERTGHMDHRLGEAISRLR